jgi:deoxyadenosine/deoxycytidine kinase
MYRDIYDDDDRWYILIPLFWLAEIFTTIKMIINWCEHNSMQHRSIYNDMVAAEYKIENSVALI